MEVQQFIKSDRRKNDSVDRLCRMPAKVISHAYSVNTASKVELTYTDSDYNIHFYDNQNKALVTWAEEGKSYTDLVNRYKDKNGSYDHSYNASKTAYVITDKETNDTVNYRFLTQDSGLVSDYTQQYNYNGKNVIVDNQKYVLVKLLGGDEEELVFPNKTGVLLSYGDSVWVYYWKDISSGYISLDNTNNTDIASIINRFANIEIGRVVFNIATEESEWNVFNQEITFQKKHRNPKVFTQVTSYDYRADHTLISRVKYLTNSGCMIALCSAYGNVPKYVWFVDYLVIDI